MCSSETGSFRCILLTFRVISVIAVDDSININKINSAVFCTVYIIIQSCKKKKSKMIFIKSPGAFSEFYNGGLLDSRCSPRTWRCSIKLSAGL